MGEQNGLLDQARTLTVELGLHATKEIVARKGITGTGEFYSALALYGQCSLQLHQKVNIEVQLHLAQARAFNAWRWAGMMWYQLMY